MPLTLLDLTKRYVGPDGSAVPVIDIASLRIDDGEQVALIGTSGSGKTTLLHLIAGILAPAQDAKPFLTLDGKAPVVIGHRGLPGRRL